MRKKLLCSALLLSLGFPLPAHAGQDVLYFDGETELQGYWVTPECSPRENTPVVMIVHQWKGLGEYEKRRAEQIADHCYYAFAIDMYGKDIRPQTREEAGALAGKYKKDSGLARGRLHAALDFARATLKNENVPVAAMGYCFGGTMALELARSGADIKGAVSFHGGLTTQAPVNAQGIITAAIQVHHGAADPNVPPEEVRHFTAEMNKAAADWHLIQYADAVHSFTEKEAGDDPSDGSAYNRKADERSWAYTLDFLDDIFAVVPDEMGTAPKTP